MSKINYLLFLIITLPLLMFTSCSSDDESNEETNTFKSEIYLDNEKQDISELVSNIYYRGYDKEISLSIVSENEDKRLSYLDASFEGADFYTLKVGDDLVQKAEYVNYMLMRNKDAILYSMVKDPYDQKYKGYIGKAIVRNINTATKYLEIEFQDAIIVNSAKAERKIKGTFGYSVTIQEHKP